MTDTSTSSTTSSTIVLDTHVWMWLLREPRRLSRAATGALERSARHGGLVVADVTLYEVAVAVLEKKILLKVPLREWLGAALAQSNVRVAPLTTESAALAAQLAAGTKDPCDRMIVATAMTLKVPLVTADGAIQESGWVDTIW